MPSPITHGYRTGKLTVQGPAGFRGHSKLWLCACDCGNRITLDSRVLQRGAVVSCGCVPKQNARRKDITGQTFGYLTAIRPTEQRSAGGSVVWHCRCACGNEVDVPLVQLTAGNNKSCGCRQYRECRVEPGQRYGRLTVSEKLPERRGTMNLWRCVCDCGNEVTAGQTQLLDGSAQSCGCLRIERINRSRGVCGGTIASLLEREKPQSNKSGVTGVYRNRRSGKWLAQINFKKQRYYLGSYDNMEDAVAARKAAEQMHTDFLAWYHATRPASPARAPQEGAAVNQ